MTSAAACAPDPRVKALTLVAERLMGWLPVIILAYPLIVWPMVFGVAESARGLTDTPDQMHAANPFNRLFFPAAFLIAVAGASLVPMARLRPLLSAPMLLLALYLAWSALSVGWALEPGIALRRLIAQCFMLGALVLSLLSVRDIEPVIRRVLALIVFAAFLNLAVVVTGPPGPLGYEGIYTQKNTLGAAGALIMFFALYAMLSHGAGLWLTGLLVLPVSLVLMVASESKTSLGVALMAPGLALAMVFAARTLRFSAAFLMAVVIGLCTLVFFVGEALGLWDFALVAETLFGDPTLTSRTDIWGFATEMIARRPIFGYGFESFWGIGYEGPAHREAPGFVSQMPHAHNGYIDTLLQTGLIGLVILVAFLAAALHAASDRKLPPLTSWLILAVSIYMIGQNFLETTWFSTLSFNWICFLIMVTLAVRGASGPIRQ